MLICIFSCNCWKDKKRAWKERALTSWLKAVESSACEPPKSPHSPFSSTPNTSETAILKATVHGVTKSQTRLKQLSLHTHAKDRKTQGWVCLGLLFCLPFSHLKENDGTLSLSLPCTWHKFHKVLEFRDPIYTSTRCARGALRHSL